MNAQNETALENRPAGMSEASRIAGVFFEPQKAFSDVAARPRWVVPLVLVILVSLAVLLAFNQHVGWDRMIRRQFESNPRTAEMPATQRERATQMAAKLAPAGAAGGVVLGIPIMDLVIAGVFLLILKVLLSIEIAFRQVWAIVCYAALPRLISGVLSIVVMFLKSPDDFDLKNPIGFNPGAYMDPETSSKFLYTLAGSLDFFSIWIILLMATGIKAAAGRKLSFLGSLLVVVVPWAIFVLARAAITTVFT